MQYDYRKLSDRELVELARQGDQLSYRAIYEKHENALRAKVSGFFKWKADVDDVVSVSFQKFFSRLDSFDNSRELLPWLYSIATRTALDLLGGIRREDEKKNAEESPELLLEENPEDEIITRQEHERLMGYIGELPPKYREIMQKYMLEELEYEEIARQVGLPLNTVRTRIHRGKSRLAEMMSRGEVV